MSPVNELLEAEWYTEAYRANSRLLEKRVALVDINEKLAMSFLSFVSQRYKVLIVPPSDADYILFSADGWDILNYKKAVRIFVTGECVPPNFLIADYAAAFDDLSYGDRYLQLPLLRLYQAEYPSLTNDRRPIEEIVSEKDSFCSYVMSNTKNSAVEREQIFDTLSVYRQVNSGGAWRNNVGGRVADKAAFQRRHKFSIAFENYSFPGYLTEKFSQAAAVDAIPIYWGDPNISDIFNSKAFINVHDYSGLDEVVDAVAEIDQNDELYHAMLAEPWFKDGVEPYSWSSDRVTGFISDIFEKPLSAAFRRNRGRWGLKKERELLNMAHHPCRHQFRKWRKSIRSFRHRLLGRKV